MLETSIERYSLVMYSRERGLVSEKIARIITKGNGQGKGYLFQEETETHEGDGLTRSPRELGLQFRPREKRPKK